MRILNLFRHLTYQVFAPGTLLRERYEAFRQVLTFNRESLELIAELESIYHEQKKTDISRVEQICARLSACVDSIVINLNKLSPIAYIDLDEHYRKIDFYIRFALAPLRYAIEPPYQIPIGGISSAGEMLVGGKAHRIGIIRSELGLPAPAGFVITTHAYNYFCEYNDLKERIAGILAQIDIGDPHGLAFHAGALHCLIEEATIPPAIKEAISGGVRNLNPEAGRPLRMAVRSSAVGEDSSISFAGQYLTLLGVAEEEAIGAYKKIIASKFSPHSLAYRIGNGFIDAETPMAVLFMEMVDARTSGVLYTEDPLGSSPGSMILFAVPGLGESLVGGSETPSRIEIQRLPAEKPGTLMTEHPSSREPEVSPDFSFPIRGILPVSPLFQRDARVDFQVKREMSSDCPPGNEQAMQIASMALLMEEFFRCPLDIEWSIDKIGRIFILQARPLAVQNPATSGEPVFREEISNPVLFRGGSRASPGAGTGAVCISGPQDDPATVPRNSVLVSGAASVEFAQIAGRLVAAVFESGSAAGHFASVARESGIPMMVNASGAMAALQKAETITVDADTCTIYEGAAAFPEKKRGDERASVFRKSPFMKKLRSVLDLVSPLHLTDPNGDHFKPEGCRSFHDIIRFAHEKAMHEMFCTGTRGGTPQRGAQKLDTNLPIIIYVVDIGDGISAGAKGKKTVRISEISNPLFQSVWTGLTHPDIHWSSDLLHMDWAELERISAGGIISVESPLLASFAVVSGDYLNFSIRFGYHFAVVDSYLGARSEENSILFSFKGGGSGYHGIMLRVDFLVRVLAGSGFRLKVKGDLVEATLTGSGSEETKEKLRTIGALLGCTRLMDYVLKDESDAEALARQFLSGDYRFGHLRGKQSSQEKD